MTEAIYLEVTEKTEAAKKAGRQVSVSGMLKFLGVSRSGYLAWLHHVPSDTEKRREAVKAKIQDMCWMYHRALYISRQNLKNCFGRNCQRAGFHVRLFRLLG